MKRRDRSAEYAARTARLKEAKRQEAAAAGLPDPALRGCEGCKSCKKENGDNSSASGSKDSCFECARCLRDKALRPTAAERIMAMDAIQRMREAGILNPKGRPPDVAVVACAMALRAGERFESDRAAKRLFGKRPETDVRQTWVDGHLAQLATYDVTIDLVDVIDDVGGEAGEAIMMCPSHLSSECILQELGLAEQHVEVEFWS